MPFLTDVRIALVLAVLLWMAACTRGAVGKDTARGDSARTQSAASADSTTLATEDCVRGEPEPALPATAPSAGQPRFERTGKLEATEEFQLNDTTSLRITHGGCAHYVETYAFAIRGAVRDTADARYWLARAAEYLRALPVVETRQGQIGQMVRALNDAARAPAPYAYGEAIRASEMALVWFTVRQVGQGAVVVEVVFDVAL